MIRNSIDIFCRVSSVLSKLTKCIINQLVSDEPATLGSFRFLSELELPSEHRRNEEIYYSDKGESAEDKLNNLIEILNEFTPTVKFLYPFACEALLRMIEEVMNNEMMDNLITVGVIRETVIGTRNGTFTFCYCHSRRTNGKSRRANLPVHICFLLNRGCGTETMTHTNCTLTY